MNIERMITRFFRLMFRRQVNRTLYRGTGIFRRSTRRDPDTLPQARQAPPDRPAGPASLPDEAERDARPTASQRAASRNAARAARLTRHPRRSRSCF